MLQAGDKHLQKVSTLWLQNPCYFLSWMQIRGIPLVVLPFVFDGHMVFVHIRGIYVHIRILGLVSDDWIRISASLRSAVSLCWKHSAGLSASSREMFQFTVTDCSHLTVLQDGSNMSAQLQPWPVGLGLIIRS